MLRNLQDCPGRQPVVGRDDKGKSKNAGDRGQLHERQISRGHIPEQVPRKPDVRQVHHGKFHGHPQERRGKAGARFARAPQPRDPQRKRRVKQRRGENQQREHGPRLDHGQRAVLAHHVVKPRHAERVICRALQPSQQQGESRPCPQDRNDQDCRGNPSENRNIEQRKGQGQRNAGSEREQKPDRPGKVHSHGIVDRRCACCTRGKRKIAGQSPIMACIGTFPGSASKQAMK